MCQTPWFTLRYLEPMVNQLMVVKHFLIEILFMAMPSTPRKTLMSVTALGLSMSPLDMMSLVSGWVLLKSIS